MKNSIYKYLFLSIISLFIITCSDDSSNGTSPELVIDQNLVGTWDLTKITVDAGTQTIELTPEQAGIASTSVFNSDGTFESINTDSDGTTTDVGTWGTNGGILTINIEGEDPESVAYTLNGNVVTLTSTVPIEGVGEVPAMLEFTKRM